MIRFRAQLDKYTDQSDFTCHRPLLYHIPFKILSFLSCPHFPARPQWDCRVPSIPAVLTVWVSPGFQSYQLQRPGWSSWKWHLWFLDSPSISLSGSISCHCLHLCFFQVCFSVYFVSGFHIFPLFPSRQEPLPQNLAGRNILILPHALFNYSDWPGLVLITLSSIIYQPGLCLCMFFFIYGFPLFLLYLLFFFFPIKNVIDQMLWKEQTLSFHIPLHSCLFLYQWLKKQRGARWGWSWSKPTSFWHHLERDFASLLQQHRLEGGKGGEVLSERKQKKMWVVLEWSS